MANSKKPKESEHNKLDSVQSDTIILSNMDDSMPAALAVDGDGLYDFDKKNAEQDVERIEAIKQAAADREIQSMREEAGITSDASDKKPRTNPLNFLLRLLRAPERWLINAWYKSPFRKKLHEKYEWYREFENTQEVRHRLENAYGGSTKPLGNLAHFFRNNVLTTLALTVLVGHLFVSYLSQPVLNRYASRGNAANVDAGAAEAAAAAIARQVDAELRSSLGHCSVTNDLRHVVDGERDTALKKNVLAEISSFIEVYSDSDLEQWYASRTAKRDMTIDQVLAVLPRIQNYSEQVSQEISRLVGEHTTIMGKLDEIDVTTKAGINQFIRIRSQLVLLDEQIRYSPSITRTISIIDGQTLRLKKIMSGFIEKDTTGMSRWAVTTSQQDLDSLDDGIASVVQNDVDANLVDLALDNAETKLYRLQILAATLRDFGDLIAHLGEQSNHTAIKVAESQSTSNKRLRDLLGMRAHQDVNLLNYDNCLPVQNPASTKLTSHQAISARAAPST